MISQIAATIGRFFSDPISSSLLIGEVVATILVGVGIVLEIPKNPTCREKIAMWLVIVGIVAETICSVWLFTHDASIIEAQNDQIVRLMGPRLPDIPKFFEAIKNGPSGTVKIIFQPNCPDCQFAAETLDSMLLNAGWKSDGVYAVDRFPEGVLPFGITVSGAHLLTGNPPHNARIPYETLLLALASSIVGSMQGREDNTIPAGKVLVYIGPKP